MKTAEQFIGESGIVAFFSGRAINPNMEGSKMMNNYTARLINGQGEMFVPFSMGRGIKRGPVAADVLDCMASEACGFENAKDFEDWAADYGYDLDSYKARMTFKVIGE